MALLIRFVVSLAGKGGVARQKRMPERHDWPWGRGTMRFFVLLTLDAVCWPEGQCNSRNHMPSHNLRGCDHSGKLPKAVCCAVACGRSRVDEFYVHLGAVARDEKPRLMRWFYEAHAPRTNKTESVPW